jgi:hypothetical protein
VGIRINSPEPLRNCPTLPIWQKRSGQVYLVFIDETFSGFFEMRDRGYFCHAAVGIPEAEYAAVGEEMKPLFERFKDLLVPDHKEFKHTEFKRIPFAERSSLARASRDVLYEHGCFISGFYSPVDAYLLERVRTDLLGDVGVKSVPADHKALLAQKAEDLKAGWDGPGHSAIIRQLLLTPLSGLLNFAGAIDVRIRIIYDPRGPREDKAVWKALLDLQEGFGKAMPKTASRLLDVNITSKSEDEIGLQIADLAAGEVRAFFDANPQFMEYGASPKLITPDSDEPVEAWIQLKGRQYKSGSVISMPGALQKRFFNPDPKERSVLPIFTDVLMCGMLTCFSSWGTPRHVAAFDKHFMDQLD